jgi:hypothetical protein
MISLIILGLVALSFFLFLIVQVFHRHSRRDELALTAQLTPVDLDAFENLTDPAEEAYLRLNLPPVEFRRVQRGRIRAAKMYVAALSQNASALVAVGQSARHHSNPEIVASGQQLLQRAVRLKMWCLASEVRLNAAMAFPTLLYPSNSISSRYLAAKHMAASLSEKSVA